MFNLYTNLERNKILLLKTKSSFLKKLFHTYRSISFDGSKFKKADIARSQIFVLNVSLLHDKRLQQNKSFFQPLLNRSFTEEERRPILLLSTPQGSWGKVDYLKKSGMVGLVKEDALAEYLLLKINSLIYFLNGLCRIHGAWVKKRRSSFLLIGESGVGKTTIAKLWLNNDREAELIEDDNVFVYFLDNNIYGFSIMQELHWPISCLFFLKKETEAVSKIYPISYKEAFKRIIFHSDVIFKKNDKDAEYRLDILGKLVSKCKCFVFINGKNLNDDPKRFNKLIDKFMKKNGYKIE